MQSSPSPAKRALAVGGVGVAALLNIWSVAQASSSPSATTAASLSAGAATPTSTGASTGPAAGAGAAAGAAGTSTTSAPGPAASGTPAAGGTAATAPGATVAPSPTTSAPAQTALLEQGKGTFTPVAVPADVTANTATAGKAVTYSVEVEDGIVTDNAAFARAVATTLQDQRGWQKYGAVHFVNVAPEQVKAGAKVDVRVTLATPKTVDAVCAPLDTMGQVSCHNKGRVALNLTRWVTGATSYGTDLTGYRTYLVNHEVGHNLGNGHVSCPGDGRSAPVMMQQTKGLDGCVASPWPADKG